MPPPETRVTTEPPQPPPALWCPKCLKIPMQYLHSFVSGVQRFDQWDLFVCARCHAVYEYRQRTRTLRVVDKRDSTGIWSARVVTAK